VLLRESEKERVHAQMRARARVCVSTHLLVHEVFSIKFNVSDLIPSLLQILSVEICVKLIAWLLVHSLSL
jgi:hypothetical protein